MPSFATSGTVFAAASNIVKGRRTLDEKEETEENLKDIEAYGVNTETNRARFQLCSRWASEENNAGGNDEARLCLKTVDGECSWGVCEDYREYVLNLAKIWEERVAESQEQKLRVRSVFAEDDFMIGVRGKKYFEETWDGRCGSGILFESSFVPGTDHDGTMDVVKGTFTMLFRVAKGEA